MLRPMTLSLTLAASLALPLYSQDSGSDHKGVDVRSSVGDLHVGDDADAKKVGVPLYPGARPKVDDKNDSQANLSILTEAFGMKLVVANYVSDDTPSKIVDFYRDKLKRYGKVLECHSSTHINMDFKTDKSDKSDSDDLTCEEHDGNNIELKVGSKENQHIVSVEPNGKGSSFALVYVRTHSKEADI